MKAIPTIYRGVTFRSRLEAQWAVFWDTLEVQWTYEDFRRSNGEEATKMICEHLGIEFDENDPWIRTGCGHYKAPDFRLEFPDGIIFHEVKPTWPSDDYLCMLRMISSGLRNYPLVLSVGGFRNERHAPYFCFHPYHPLASIWFSSFMPVLLGNADHAEAASKAENYRFDLCEEANL